VKMCSCIGSCVGGCVASACTKACCGKSKESKTGHLIFLFLTTVVALILRYWGAPLLIHFYSYNIDICTSDSCYGEGAVYRISVALFVFFLFHALGLLLGGGSCIRKPSYAANWALKLLFFIGLLVAAFFIPNQFYDDGYVHIARLVSGVFLVLQIILLIDFAYRWNENWMADDKEWTKAIIAVCVVLFTGCLILFGFMAHWFGGSACDRNNFFLSTTFLLPMLFTCLSVTAWCEHGALLTSAVVAAYCYWLGFSALSSDPSACNALSSDSNETLHLVLGLIIASLTVTYAGYNLSNQQFMGGELQDEKEAKIVDSSSAKSDKDVEKQVQEDAAKKQEKEDEAQEQSEEAVEASRDEVKLACKFHIFMACSGCYMAMLLTSWGATMTSTGSPTSYDVSTENLWIKMVTQWAAALLYTWTLVAPYLFPDRSF